MTALVLAALAAVARGGSGELPRQLVHGRDLEEGQKEPHGIGVKKDRPDYPTFVNDQLAGMKKGGRWNVYYEKWLGKSNSVSANSAIKRLTTP